MVDTLPDVKERLRQIPGYQEGMPAHRMDGESTFDELELTWDRKWGAQSCMGELKLAWIHRWSNEPSEEQAVDPVFFNTIAREPEDPPMDYERRNLQLDELAAAVESEGVEVVFGEAVTIAVPWAAVEEVASKGGDWTGKVVIDANNRFAPVSESGASAAEDLARLAAGSRVVKAFNTIGFGRLSNPRFDSQAASMFICGDDQDAKSVVSTLTAELGFDVVDAGSLANAKLLESLAALWVTLARGGYGLDIGFKSLRD